MKKEICCGGYVIENQKVLLVKHNKGHWDFPKGHKEEGETNIQTAKREVLEETGIEIEVVNNREYKIKYSPKPNIEKTVIFYEAKKIGGKECRQECEIEKLEWLTFEDAIERITYENSKKEFIKFLKEKGWL